MDTMRSSRRPVLAIVAFLACATLLTDPALALDITNYVNAGAIGTVTRQMRMLNRRLEWLNVNAWNNVGIAGQVP